MNPEAQGQALGLSEVEKLAVAVRRSVAKPGSVRPEGEYFIPAEANAFGLRAVDSCPGSTGFCRQRCYAIDSEDRPRTGDKMQSNLDIMRAAGSVEEMTDLLLDLFELSDAKSAKAGVPEASRFFRDHWDGDFFSEEYAWATRAAIEANPDRRFLVYTRSFQPDVNVVPILAGLENLDLFLSVDCENVDRAAEVLAEHTEPRVAYFVDYAEEAEELKQKLGRTEGYVAPVCPENLKDSDGKRRLPVISEKGGACAVCRICISKPESDPKYRDKSKWDVVFVFTGYRQNPYGQHLPFDELIPTEAKPRRKKAEEAPIVGSVALAETLPSLF